MDQRLRQIHIRVMPELKKALKVFCAREGITEQAWLLGVIEFEMSRQAADLWPATTHKKNAGERTTKESGETSKTRRER